MTFYDLDDLDWTELGNGWDHAHVDLEQRDTSWAPRQEPVYGPAHVHYTRSPSGAINVYVTKTARFAITH